ncbi:MAG: hypothetical protein ACP5QK_01365 [Myxococcota bacterium]
MNRIKGYLVYIQLLMFIKTREIRIYDGAKISFYYCTGDWEDYSSVQIANYKSSLNSPS